MGLGASGGEGGLSLRPSLRHTSPQGKPLTAKNGTTKKTPKSTSSSFELETPCDRSGTFEPQLVMAGVVIYVPVVIASGSNPGAGIISFTGSLQFILKGERFFLLFQCDGLATLVPAMVEKSLNDAVDVTVGGNPQFQ